MEIILKEDIIGLGYKNDIVNVKSGYGRNYLIPKGLGVIASPSAKKVLAENLKQQASKLAALKAAAVERAKQIITMHDAKRVGNYEATVHFHKEVEIKVPVTVVAENEAELKAEREAEEALRAESAKVEAPAEEAAEAPAETEAPAAPAEEEAPAEA